MAISQIGTDGLASGQTMTSPSLVTPTVTTTIGVGGATPANTGAGVSFPATQNASSDANTLDDYEEGSWTPSVSLGTITYGNPVYTKVGRLVTVSAYIQGFSDRTTATAVSVYGLPFTAGAAQNVGPMFMRQSSNSVTACYASGGAVYFNFYGTTSGAYAPLLHSQLNASNSEIYFSLTYIV